MSNFDVVLGKYRHMSGSNRKIAQLNVAFMFLVDAYQRFPTDLKNYMPPADDGWIFSDAFRDLNIDVSQFEQQVAHTKLNVGQLDLFEHFAELTSLSTDDIQPYQIAFMLWLMCQQSLDRATITLFEGLVNKEGGQVNLRLRVAAVLATLTHVK